MSEKFTSKDLLSRLRMVPPLAYEFTTEEVLKDTNRFLQYVGYQLQPPLPVESALHFHAKRQDGPTTYEIVGLVASQMDDVPDKTAKLKTLKAARGEGVDYVIALPPVNEFHLLEFLRLDDGKYRKDILRERFMLWLCNPQKQTMWCFLGAPQDKLFEDYFILRSMRLNPGMRSSTEGPDVSRLLSPEWNEEEEEE